MALATGDISGIGEYYGELFAKYWNPLEYAIHGTRGEPPYDYPMWAQNDPTNPALLVLPDEVIENGFVTGVPPSRILAQQGHRYPSLLLDYERNRLGRHAMVPPRQDSAATISSTTGLDAPMRAGNLTVDARLNLLGFPVFAHTITITENGRIAADGGNGNGVNGGNTAQNANAFFNGGTAGGSGGSAGFPGGSPSGDSLAAGGLGGVGFNGSGAATILDRQLAPHHDITRAMSGFAAFGVDLYSVWGGLGGSGGGVSVDGGGGGAGAAQIFIVCENLIIESGGQITALGGNGGDSPGGNGNGGCGGGGGVIFIACRYISNAGVLDTRGGLGGAATGSGAVGDTGSAGSIFINQL